MEGGMPLQDKFPCLTSTHTHTEIFVPKGQMHNNKALVQIKAWRRIGNKTLAAEPMLTWFTDSLMRH